MKKTNINYPHPVLSGSNEDYLNCSFDIDLLSNPVIEGDVATFAISYDLSCPSLEEYISSKEAKVVVYLESVVAEFRAIRPFASTSRELTITLNKNDINQEVEMLSLRSPCPRLSCRNTIKNCLAMFRSQLGPAISSPYLIIFIIFLS